MRHDDKPDSKSHFQSDRYFVVSGKWYFTTREGEDFGPFENRGEAEVKLNEYLETQQVMQRLRDRDPQLEDHNEKNTRQIAELASDIQKDRRD